jgi:hypothetical protein
MRSALLYFLGVPIPIILILALFTHTFDGRLAANGTRG